MSAPSAPSEASLAAVAVAVAEAVRDLSHAFAVDSPEWTALRRAESLVRSVGERERTVVDAVPRATASCPDASHAPWAWAIVRDGEIADMETARSRPVHNVLALDLAAEYAEKTPGATVHALYVDPLPWGGGGRAGPLDWLERLLFLHRQRPKALDEALRAAGEHEHLYARNAAYRSAAESLGSTLP